MAFDNSVTKAVSAARLGTTPKRCELPLFFARILQAICRWKALNLGSLRWLEPLVMSQVVPLTLNDLAGRQVEVHVVPAGKWSMLNLCWTGTHMEKQTR